RAELSRVEGRSDPGLWRQVVDAFDYGYVYEVARSRHRLAEALLGAGQREEAERELRRAHAVALELGAAPVQREMVELARRGRLDLPGVRREAGPSALTPRELEVLRLVA